MKFTLDYKHVDRVALSADNKIRYRQSQDEKYWNVEIRDSAILEVFLKEGIIFKPRLMHQKFKTRRDAQKELLKLVKKFNLDLPEEKVISYNAYPLKEFPIIALVKRKGYWKPMTYTQIRILFKAGFQEIEDLSSSYQDFYIKYREDTKNQKFISLKEGEEFFNYWLNNN